MESQVNYRAQGIMSIIINKAKSKSNYLDIILTWLLKNKILHRIIEYIEFEGTYQDWDQILALHGTPLESHHVPESSVLYIVLHHQFSYLNYWVRSLKQLCLREKIH